jgi:hypothetical protein
MTRALLEMDAAACLNVDGDPSAAADKAAAVWQRLPHAYRNGLVRTRAEALHRALPEAARPHFAEVLAS